MSAASDRLSANTAIANARAAAARCVAPCRRPPPVQALDVRVRDSGRGLPVRGVLVTIRQAGGGGAVIQSKLTDSSGDAIFRLPAGNYHVSSRKNWHVPDPAEQDNVNVPEYGFPQVPLDLQELRYYLHVDADRNGVVDDRHEGLDVIVPWSWGATRRGAVILCNNDHDGGLAIAMRRLDNADDVVNGGNDGTHEVAPLRIFRDGPTTPPRADHHWRARLEILGGHEDKVRIFRAAAAGSAQLIGAAHGAAAANAQHDFDIRVGLPAASMPTTDLGIEALTYARAGFTGKVQIKLTVSCDVAPSYFTAAEVRVAPWMMPNHRDDARRVYVVDLGPDVVVAGGVINRGNSTFRTDLAAALPGGVPLVQHANHDRWMQDCMEIGYSVLPKSAGGNTRHRIEAVMQAYRDFGLFDLKDHARSLLDADFGFLFPGASSELAAHAAAIAGGVGATEVRRYAEWGILNELMRQAKAGAMVGDGVSVADGNTMEGHLTARNMPAARGELTLEFQLAVFAAIDEVEAAHRAAPTAAAARDDALRRARAALIREGPPVDAWADVIAEAAASVGAEASNRTNTFDSNGNLECSPPCLGSGKTYPWGRVYYGRGSAPQVFDPATREFLEKQVVQRPFPLDTDWLLVGHVDEMLSFIPAPGPAFKSWKALVASPRKAFDMLDHLPPATPILVGRHLEHGGAWVPVATTVGLLRRGTTATPILDETGTPMTGNQIRDYNLNTVQPNIVNLANTLRVQIGAMTSDIIPVPVIFKPEDGRKAGALTGDMVNMLVVNGRCIVPKPFGPETAPGADAFEAEVTRSIGGANGALTVRFVDDWYTYHAKMGEIHCGSNTNRHPANLATWLGSQDAEWWRFIP